MITYAARHFTCCPELPILRPEFTKSSREVQTIGPPIREIRLAAKGKENVVITNQSELKLAIEAVNLRDVLRPTEYVKAEYDYCMIEDDTGNLAVNTVYPNCSQQMPAR